MPRPLHFADRRRIHRGALAVIACGGLLGSAARVAIMAAFPSDGFPGAVLAVNLVGSLLLGLYVTLRQRALVHRVSTRFWAIGVLGSFTTFSSFSVDLIRLTMDTGAVVAFVYLCTSVIGGLVAALVGMRIGRVQR